ncbi:hypothetical protein D3C85_1199470 [compost metagenome]
MQLAALQRGDERGLVDHLAARRVDDDRAARQRRKLRGAEHLARVAVERHVQAEHIAQRQQRIERRQQAHAGHWARAFAEGRVERGHLHAEREADPGHALADLAEADQAQRLAVQLHAVLCARPAAIVQLAVHPADAACGGEHQAERHLCDRLRVGAGRDVDRNAARGGRLDVDVAHAHAML